MKYKRKKNFTRIEVKRVGPHLTLSLFAHDAKSQLRITRYNGGELTGFVWASMPGVGTYDCVSSGMSPVEITAALQDIFGAWGTPINRQLQTYAAGGS